MHFSLLMFIIENFKYVLIIWTKMKNIMYRFGVVRNGNVVELQRVTLKAVNHVLNGTKHRQIHLSYKMAIIIALF